MIKISTRSSVIGAALGLLLLASSAIGQEGAARQPSVELPAELERVLRDYERAWAAGDEGALAQLFTEDGFVSGERGWIHGRAAIEQEYENAQSDLRLRAVSFSRDETTAFIVGAYGSGSEAATRDRGKFVLALRREEPTGRWLIVADLDRSNQPGAPVETEVTIDSEGWALAGDLRMPSANQLAPAVLLLHRAAGTRQEYAALAWLLGQRGVASLRVDLRGHGESINRGRFLPDNREASISLDDTPADIVAAHRFLAAQAGVDASRIAIVGASFSGEMMAEAARRTRYAQAYVALSPGSFSETSIRAIDPSAVPWLFISAREDRHLVDIVADLRATS